MIRRRVPIVVALSLMFTVLPTSSVSAAPATTVRYPAAAAATQFSGLAFDTCTAPSVKTMKAWRKSPYSAIGVYIGGPTRSCTQRHLSQDWVRSVSGMRWRLIPIYTGLQAPCRSWSKKARIAVGKASEQGKRAAEDAVAKSRALGLLPGSALYLDIEAYPTSKAWCRKAVLRYVSGWTFRLHRLGYLSGVYAALGSGVRHLSEAYTSAAYARPDVLWMAQWNGNSDLQGWRGVPGTQWARSQRGKQFRGPHKETHGGVTLNIDSNRFSAPVATVARAYRVISGVPLKARRSPSTKHAAVTTHQPGSWVSVVCQTTGSKVGPTRVWNKLTNGAYVSDRHLSTPSKKAYSAPLPRCVYPYQVTAPEKLNKRTGPGTSFAHAGAMPTGSLARVLCQKKGDNVLGTKVWNRLHDGGWVSDHYVATPESTGFSRPLPRCG